MKYPPRGAAIRRNFPGDTRKCARCDAVITVTEQMCKYGKYVCSACQVRRTAEYVEKNRDKKRAWVRAYGPRHPEVIAANTQLYRQRHPEQYLAHTLVQTAVRNGSLAPQPCVECGAANAHAHHEDYSKPLAVIWLCHEHHMARHHAERDREEPSK